MIVKKPLVVLFLLCTLNSFGQQVIKGKILNSITREPIPYANIGLNNSNVGTLTNPDGSFSLSIPSKLFTETLVVSSLGFGARSIPLKSILLKKEITVFLNEKVKPLNEVTISLKNDKPFIFELGNPKSNGGTMEMDTLYAGRSVSLRIDEQGESGSFPAVIESARVKIFRNNLNSFQFRIRINAVDPLTGYPGEDLLQKSIISKSSMRNGWLEFNLSELNLEVDKPFYVTFEQILDVEDRTAIANDYKKFLKEHPDKIKTDTIEIDGKKEVDIKFTGGGAIDLAGTYIGIATSNKVNENHTSYIRETSFGEWKKVRGIVAATVSLRSYKLKKSLKEGKDECETLAICKAEKIAKDFMEQNGLNGLQISIGHKNRIYWSLSSGYADVSKQIYVNDSTKFRVNSISKSITSLALVKLVAEGKLNLDSPIHRYYPEFPKKIYPITIRHIAGHLAGFRDYDENNLSDYIRTTNYKNSIQATEVFKNDTLLFKPGTRFSYSTFGWNLIGAVIEKITGTDYLNYMQTNIWKPLGLTNTCGDDKNANLTNRSKFYEVTGEENDLGDFSYKYAGGGLLSTANDLVKFGNEMLNGSYVDKKNKKVVFQTQYTADRKETGYGIGWYIGKDKNGHRIWHHAGDSFSGSSHLIIYPDDDLVISFLCNSQIGTTFNLEKIAELFYQK